MALAMDNFMVSFYAALAGLAGVDVAVTPRGLWLHRAVEAATTAVYTVVRQYAVVGDPAGQISRQPALSMQLDTRGPIAQEPAVLAEAIRLNELLRDPASSDGSPRCRWTIAGKRIVAGAVAADAGVEWIVNSVLFTGGPNLIASGDETRAMAVSNFDLVFYPA